MRSASSSSAVIIALAASRGLGARARQREVLLGEHAVEPGDDLARLHHHAFLDHHLDHLAGDFRRDGRLAPRHHVAGGDQGAGAARLGRGRGNGGAAQAAGAGWGAAACSVAPVSRSAGLK